MTKKQIKEALRKDGQRKKAQRAERLMVSGYPYSHNPYVPHEPVADCFPGCVNTQINPRFDYE